MTALLSAEVVAADAGFFGEDAARVALEFHAQLALESARDCRDLARRTRSPRLRALYLQTMRSAALRWRLYAVCPSRVA